MKLGKHEIGPHRTFIIAEAGTNFASPNGGESIGSADAYIKAAKAAGADAIKFQMFVRDEALFCPVEGDEKRRRRWDAASLTYVGWEYLRNLAEFHGLVFLASAFQPTTVKWLKKLNVEAYKVAVRARHSFPYTDLQDAHFIVSEPASGRVSQTLGGEAEQFAAAARPELLGGRTWAHLYCPSGYPSRPKGFNRGFMEREENGAVKAWSDGWLQHYDGLSDHSGTVWPGLACIADGGKYLEVHFSIHDDKHDAGNDTPVCLTTSQLKLLCEARDEFAALRSD